MATTHLTEQEAQELGIPTLIRRVQSGEEIRIESERGPILLREPESPSLDSSISATLQRFRQLETETGEPLRMGEDFADDMEKVIAMRRPGRGDPWA
jgi:hypothetical protein